MTIETQADLVDFVALAAQLTNEQKILASSLRIEELLTKLVEASSWTPRTPKLIEELPKATREEQLKALANKTMGRRK